jgi:hypothetical protein
LLRRIATQLHHFRKNGREAITRGRKRFQVEADVVYPKALELETILVNRVELEG